MWKNRLLSAAVFPAPAFLDQLDQVVAVPHQIRVAKVLKKPTTVFDNLTARLLYPLYPHRRRSGRLATTLSSQIPAIPMSCRINPKISSMLKCFKCSSTFKSAEKPPASLCQVDRNVQSEIQSHPPPGATAMRLYAFLCCHKLQLFSTIQSSNSGSDPPSAPFPSLKHQEKCLDNHVCVTTSFMQNAFLSVQLISAKL